ncbi:hypothetical protein C0995_001987 [Termitomyces sp. Mi166|nr:hypothetical protein C0995_001987 [Termitomyces sp. Mi166\
MCKMPEKTTTALNIPLALRQCLCQLDFMTNVLITSVVQSFYAWRVYCLSDGHQWQKPLVAFILATSLAQLCDGLSEATFHWFWVF